MVWWVEKSCGHCLDSPAADGTVSAELTNVRPQCRGLTSTVQGLLTREASARQKEPKGEARTMGKGGEEAGMRVRKGRHCGG